MQVGLDPKDFEMTVSAEGYVPHKEQIKIPLGDALVKNIVLKKPEELTGAVPQISAAELARTNMANSAISAYNEAVGFFNQKDFSQALPKLELALERLNEALADADSDATKSDLERNIDAVNKLFAFSLFESGKSNADERDSLWLKAEPIFKDLFEKSPNEAALAQCLADISGMKGDKEAENMYTELVEKIDGPKAENAYNKAVDLFNEGDFPGALPHLKKAVEINPSFADTYYLLAICEFSAENYKAAKEAFQKYMQLDPNGKYAGEVKEMLADPTLSKI
jgi:tetratricopeptide (TPR) repeat protein